MEISFQMIIIVLIPYYKKLPIIFHDHNKSIKYIYSTAQKFRNG